MANASDTQYGSAQLFESGQDDLARFWQRQGCNGFPLGINRQGDATGLAWWPSGLKGHHCVFGSTRSGKGVSSIIPGLISYAGSAVVIDPKGENAWATAERRRQMGHRVVILDPWGEVNRRYGAKVGVTEQTTRFNPLSSIDPQSHDFSAAVAAIADSLIMDQSDDPHWSNSAKELVSGLTALVIERSPGHASLGDVRQLISLSGKSLQLVITKHCLDYPNGVAAAKLTGYSDQNLLDGDEGTGKKPKGDESSEFRSVRSVARTQTGFLDDSDLRLAMETDDPRFDLGSIGTSPVTLYLVLPVDKLETHGRWLRLIITLAIREIAKLDAPPKPPVWFCLDEFGTIGKLQSVETAFGLLSGLGVTISAYLQGLDQLQTFYPKSYETFIGNSAVIQVLNARNKVTSDYISDYLGTMTAQINRGGYRQETYSPVNPRRDIDGNGQLETRNVPDVQQIQRPVMFPEEVRRLPESHQLIIYPGHFSAMIERLPYYSEARWAGMYRPNPLYRAATSTPPATANGSASSSAQQPEKKRWF